MTDPRLKDPILGKDKPVVGVWGWIAIFVILVASAGVISWKANQNTQPVIKIEATPPPPIVRE